MTTKTKPGQKRTTAGRPPKADGGLDEVIYVRASGEMVAQIDAMATRLSAETNLAISRSDMARKIIADAVAADAKRAR